MKDAYNDFVTKSLSAVDSVSLIRTLRVKFNIKRKPYKKCKQSVKENDKENFKSQF